MRAPCAVPTRRCEIITLHPGMNEKSLLVNAMIGRIFLTFANFLFALAFYSLHLQYSYVGKILLIIIARYLFSL